MAKICQFSVILGIFLDDFVTTMSPRNSNKTKKKKKKKKPTTKNSEMHIQLAFSIIVSEYDQEIPQSQTADIPWHRGEEPLIHHETPGRQIKQRNQLSLPHQDDCNTRMHIK